jgi:predicted lipoprotein
MIRTLCLPFVLLGILAAACSGGSGDDTPAFDDEQIVVDFVDGVVVPTYQLLASRADALAAAVDALAADTTPGNLAAARAAWVAARQPWEQSEGFLFGPVDSFGYDPALDSWPVNATDLQAVLASADPITPAYVANLSETQKGFHTIEYLLFGDGGTKTAGSFTARELEYLQGILEEFVNVAHALADAWSGPGGYREVFASAGEPGNTAYPTRARAAEEILGGMIAICDEVANGKIADPYDAHDPTLVESQFSYNSLQDFQDNIRSVENAYTADFPLSGSTGRGLSDYVAEKDAALDALVKDEIAAAIDALAAIPSPFRDAIGDPEAFDEIEAAQEAIRKLQGTLERDVRGVVLP